ncbi:MAG: hypothetical protein HC824_22340 [Synechococcales cyanobacterium RM1_1_8]|nr:hypothetical protein [Synechococcales cyanobacterium RM1_1_8]
MTVSPNAEVTDTAIAFGGNITLQKGVQVRGDVYSFGGKIIQDPGTVIGGERAAFSYRHGMIYGSHQNRSSFSTHYFFSSIFRVSAAITAAILGFIVLQTRPNFLPNLATELQQHFGLTALWGIGAVVAITFVNVFLAITLIGIPLIPLLILMTIITSLVGSLGVALSVGQRLIHGDNRSSHQQFLVGLSILTTLSLIPF